ncbi:hypothetical protein [Spiroplasma endosymbiont of Atherix ibis]|uniref:hypothetical protein n=1 Tax=Spiroplasma endosymbiont of Atherix ibis TaxID=3066291 RepID=UPI0030D5C170
MKPKKINQYFLNAIRDGYKPFEITKNPYLEGEVDLIVVNPCNKKYVMCIMKQDVYCDECIKDRLKVKLKITNMTAFEIGLVLQERNFNVGNLK